MFRVEPVYKAASAAAQLSGNIMRHQQQRCSMAAACKDASQLTK